MCAFIFADTIFEGSIIHFKQFSQCAKALSCIGVIETSMADHQRGTGGVISKSNHDANHAAVAVGLEARAHICSYAKILVLLKDGDPVAAEAVLRTLLKLPSVPFTTAMSAVKCLIDAAPNPRALPVTELCKMLATRFSRYFCLVDLFFYELKNPKDTARCMFLSMTTHFTICHCTL